MPDKEELEGYLEKVIAECDRLGFTGDETARMIEMETCKFNGLEDSEVEGHVD